MQVNGYEIKSGANLRRADLCGADLRGADLRRADLRRADLCETDLCGADLRGADLRGADLCGADLCETDLRGADLRGADLRGADLCGADLEGAHNIPNLPETIIVPEGILKVYKKVSNGIAVLQIPEHALRSNATTRKCRASEALVLECPDGATSCHNPEFKYVKGAIVKPTMPFDTDRWNECSTGIHFFLTREEAEAY